MFCYMKKTSYVLLSQPKKWFFSINNVEKYPISWKISYRFD